MIDCSNDSLQIHPNYGDGRIADDVSSSIVDCYPTSVGFGDHFGSYSSLVCYDGGLRHVGDVKY